MFVVCVYNSPPPPHVYVHNSHSAPFVWSAKSSVTWPLRVCSTKTVNYYLVLKHCSAATIWHAPYFQWRDTPVTRGDALWKPKSCSHLHTGLLAGVKSQEVTTYTPSPDSTSYFFSSAVTKVCCCCCFSLFFGGEGGEECERGGSFFFLV